MSLDDAPEWTLTLLGCWGLERNGQRVPVAFRQQRLIAALALKGGRRRGYIAGLLWPSGTDAQASGSLRACLWNVSHQMPGLLDPATEPLALSLDVAVDVRALVREMELAAHAQPGRVDVVDRLLAADLLPGWHEEWLWPEQERLDRLRIAALETIAENYLDVDRLDAALDAATAAAKMDPLRESAQRLLLRIHLADGNHGSAIRSYQAYRSLLLRECGVRPSSAISAVVEPLLRHPEDGRPSLPRISAGSDDGSERRVGAGQRRR